MIRRELDEIEERDFQGLCDTGREEDERIEFKRSFVGGNDLSSMSDPQRERAVESLAKEVTALLNGKGGDLIVGIREDEGVAQELTPIEGASEAAERLRRSLWTRIEPAPRAMRIRSIPAEGSENGAGYIVIRAESSLQAPHRVAKSKEFYIRRGTEASPMNITEVQDLTLSTRTASARIEDKLHRELAGVRSITANNRVFHGGGFQFRVVYAPLQSAQIPLEGTTLHALTNPEPTFYEGGKEVRNDVAFRSLGINWRPVLRGKLVERLVEGDQDSRAGYAAKRVHSDGTVVFDWFVRYLPQ
ncbi:MAG TPA: ATP-binding protein, partial [Terrimicrobiaceae bacterium]|nr:ATP-binding protein [Terrimicrobiaceae bacterium]